MSWIRSQIKNWLLRRGMIISRPPGQFVITPIKLRQMRARGLEIGFAIDGGAAKGAWAQQFKMIYPEAQILCIEPRDAEQSELQKMATELPGIHIAQTLIGAAVGQVEFFESGDQSSMLKTGTGNAFGKTVKADMTTLDELVRSKKLPWPDLIKLDLQGAELQALAGAAECLKHAQLVLLEVSFIAIHQNMPLIADVIPFMKERGFECYDIMGLWHRPLDGALAQGDFAFLNQKSKLLADRRWSAEHS